jgi:hypothetical protein
MTSNNFKDQYTVFVQGAGNGKVFGRY